MNEIEFARAHLGDYRVQGAEIKPRLCPYCRGGQHGDKYTFALNMDKHTFICLRGSCGKQGHFSQLLRDFGEQPDKVYAPLVTRSYVKPQPPKISREGAAMQYIKQRGISAETAAAYGVGGNTQGEVVFPYYETPEAFQTGQPVFIKYRPARKLDKGERKARREKDTKPVLFGMHLCRPENGTLYLFEGEFDAMAGYQAHGGNCVSVPSGCKEFTWLDTCADFLSQYDRVAIIGDNDAAGQEMVRALSDKLECAVCVPDFARYGTSKDANEILYRQGAERLSAIMDGVHAAETLGLLNIADIAPVDLSSLPRVLSGLPSIDRMCGGLLMGDLCEWTGKRGEGKSTILTQLALESVEQGENVCVYSGEIPANRFRYGVYLQAAGELHVCERMDERAGRVTQFVPQSVQRKIDSWLNGRFWLYDNRIAGADEAESVLRAFEKAYRRYNCRVFLVDNLMTVHTCRSERDFYQSQADFTIKLRKFAEKHGVLVHLVVHPRKTGGQAVRDNDEVGGLSTITNIACAVFNMRRLDENEAAEKGCDSAISCLKNRAYGETGNVRLHFLAKSRRFVEPGQKEKPFGWEQQAAPALPSEPPF